MPAIDLTRLRTQSSHLIEYFAQPEAFVRYLHEMLEFYTNRTIRPAQAAVRAALPSYRVPRPVMRQVARELESPAEKFPLQATALASALWGAGYLETRLLACHLMGFIPPDSAMPLFSLLPEWVQQSKDPQIRAALLTEALQRLRRENSRVLLLLIEEWLHSPDHRMQVWGLHALVPLLKEPGFENLPAAFRVLRPALETARPSTQLDLQACLSALEHLSLTETLHFLRDVIAAAQNREMLRILRRMLPTCSLELQAGLRELVRETP
jgi:hypothetical protein